MFIQNDINVTLNLLKIAYSLSTVKAVYLLYPKPWKLNGNE